MRFRACALRHGERAPWSKITHVRLTGRPSDTDQGRQVLGHIKQHADDRGVATIASIEPGFPGRKRDALGERGGMEYDLRHMANQCDAGLSEQNKGPLELGWLV
jgi:hypothetical protein